MRGVTALALAGHLWLAWFEPVISSEANSLSRRQAGGYVGFLYRGDDRSPWEIREAGGFRPWGEGWEDESFFHIDRHYNAGPSGCAHHNFDHPGFYWRTAYVSLAADRNKASRYGAWLYEIRATPNILDGGNSDSEVMALGGVHWRQIRRYAQTRDSNGMGHQAYELQWFSNPEYDFDLYEGPSAAEYCVLSIDYPDVLESGRYEPGGLDAMNAGHRFMIDTIGIRQFYGDFPPYFQSYPPRYDIPGPTAASLPPWEEDERRLRLFFETDLPSLPESCQRALRDAFRWGIEQQSCDIAIRNQVTTACGVASRGKEHRVCRSNGSELTACIRTDQEAMLQSCRLTRDGGAYEHGPRWFQLVRHWLANYAEPRLVLRFLMLQLPDTDPSISRQHSWDSRPQVHDVSNNRGPWADEHRSGDGSGKEPQHDLRDYEGSPDSETGREFSLDDGSNNGLDEDSMKDPDFSPRKQLGRPLAQIMSIVVRNIDNEDPGQLFGHIKATDRLGGLDIYKKDSWQADFISPGGKIKLKGPERPIEADTTFFINFDLWDWDRDWSANDKIGEGRFTWDVTKPPGAYDKPVVANINGPNGEVSLELTVIRNAVAAQVEIYVLNGDDENWILVVGDVHVASPIFDYIVFDDNEINMTDVQPGDKIHLHTSTFAVSLEHSLEVRINLWDYDSGSANDEIAKGTATFAPQFSGEVRQQVTGAYGKVEVRVTWS
ncbi:putative heat-labile enterotoxin [Ophiocordyceps camponoti-saundersi (nom. inval.)]|nr:putative heat-labile enterotoxin [Ophiocordyceps camponoti-saundersi (nom. inval.)]